MSHIFSIVLSGHVSDAVARVRAQILGGGGYFDGDEQRGVFGGRVPVPGIVRGEYETVGQQVTVSIIEKPRLVPASKSESKIREYFEAD